MPRRRAYLGLPRRVAARALDAREVRHLGWPPLEQFSSQRAMHHADVNAIDGTVLLAARSGKCHGVKAWNEIARGDDGIDRLLAF